MNRILDAMTRGGPQTPPEVARLVQGLLAGTRAALGDNLAGFYLRGSLALGDYNPETSDVDILVVTERPVSQAEFEALASLHKRMPSGHGPGAHHYEVSYIDRASIKRFRPGDRRHPTVGTDWAFQWGEHRDNWVLERWTVRERGVALLGPDPKTLIDPILPEELKDAARSELLSRVRDWAGGAEPPDWLMPRYYQAFEVETVCRALYTVGLGELPTKPQAIAWALDALPEEWRPLVQWSQRYRADKTEDPSMIPEVKRFARWAASEGSAK